MKPGWEVKTLGEVCTFRNGLWTGKKGPFVTAKVIRNTNIRANGVLSLDDVAEIEVEAKQFKSRKLNFGDIILEKSGGGPKQPVGRAVCFEMHDEDFSFSNFTAAITVADAKTLDYRFLHLVLNWWHSTGVTEKIQSNSTGIRNLDFSAYKALQIPFPPLNEQKRIVEVLNAAFEGLSRARAHTESNLQNARELFESFLDEVFDSDLSEWQTQCIAEICLVGDGNHSSKYPKKSEMVEAGVPFLRSSNIQDGAVSRDEMLFISEEKHAALKKGHLKAGDILFTNRGEIGKIALVPEDLDGSNLNSQVAWLRCNRNVFNEFLYFFLMSRKLKQHYISTQSGAALQQFTIKMLKSVVVAYPEIASQKDIVTRIRTAENAARTLQFHYRAKLADLDALRQALLQKAFAGELT